MKTPYHTSLLKLLTVFACTGLLTPSFAQPTADTLRYVPQSDVKVMDPGFTTNYQTRNFGYLVFDTLFGLDAKGRPQPQMIDKFSRSADGRQWSFTLRPGLKFHDGQPVTSADCIASLERWSTKDSYGRAMIDAGARWKAVDDKTFTLSLDEPFGLVLEALSKVSSFAPFILPARLIKAAGNGPVNDAIGSGPFIFKRDEWAPGSKLVFVRNPAYVGRSEPASFLAGNKKSLLPRIEWLILPDANSATAAVRNGEVDMLEVIPPDQIATLYTEPSVRVAAAGAYQASLILNETQAPFNNEKARQALLMAVNQEKFVAAMGYPANLRMKYCASLFMCGSANETSAGAAPYAKPDLEKAKRLLAESGYHGEKVVLLVPTDNQPLNGAALVAMQTLKQVGFNVDAQSMDWATLVSRRVSKEPVERGGWSAYATFAVSSSVDSPLSNFMLGASCGNSMPGWPCDKKLDDLRKAWLKEPVPAARRKILDQFQERAYQSLPYVPVGQYSGAFAVRKNVQHSELLDSDVPTLWMLSK
jgi:peptide/nickel transport system substrate-binding protein